MSTNGQTALYRHFDAEGRLLYVGVAANPLRRLAQHEKHAAWFGAVAEIKIEWFASRPKALRAELSAIGKEQPLHNVVHQVPQAAAQPDPSDQIGATIRAINAWLIETGISINTAAKAAKISERTAANVLRNQEGTISSLNKLCALVPDSFLRNAA